MDMEAGDEPGRDRPVEHARVFRVLAGDKKHHRMATKYDPLVLVRHVDDRGGTHLILH
jgi:hypothetical protein